MSAEPNANGTGIPEQGPSSDGRRRLPPPAFPPGARRPAFAKAEAPADGLEAALISPDDPIPDRTGEVPADAFFLPDDPITRGARETDPGAFISPDDPIRPRAPRGPSLAALELDPDEVVVTGIGDDAHLAPEDLAVGFDPHVLEVVDKVGKLAESLKRKGEAGLRTTPEMSRFEATLRAYCVGYIAGRRAEEEEAGGPPTTL